MKIDLRLLIKLCALVIGVSAPGTSNSGESDDFRLLPFYAVDDRELYLFASNFIGLIRSVTEEPPSENLVPIPNYMLFSELDAIVDGRIQSEKAKKLFEGDEWDYLASLRSTSGWCKIVPIISTKNPQSLEVITIIDEGDSTRNGRKNCFLASVIQIYQLDIEISDYFDRSPDVLALDILRRFLNEN